MSPRRDSLKRTLLVAASVAFACSALVSTAVYLLRPMELAYAAVERNRAILDALGGAEAAGLSDADVVAAFVELEVRAVDLATGRFTDAVDAAAYDVRAAVDDPQMQVQIPAAADTAGLARRPAIMPVYIAASGPRIDKLVLPIHARGMWSTIHGVVALEADLETIAGVSFFEHGETPGIGDRIEAGAWRAQWRGKRIYGADGEPAFRIGGDAGEAAARYRVDGITGATITVSAIDRAIRYWFSADAYGPLLARLRSEGS